MRIAIPTGDGVSIAEHFGRSAAFLVFEVEDGKITGRQMRPNSGQCHAGGAGEERTCGAREHGGIVARIADCQMVLCCGMGQGAADALRAHGIMPVFVQPAGTAEEMLRLYLAGRVAPANGSLCRCHH